ncbi:MAG: hypothetical protein K2L06_04835 [Alistipes sp.]|nr:hypothetical protein [Alistipes sp.]
MQGLSFAGGSGRSVFGPQFFVRFVAVFVAGDSVGAMLFFAFLFGSSKNNAFIYEKFSRFE